MAALRRIEQTFRCCAVHHHLAGDEPEPPPLRLGEECVGTLRMHAAIDEGGRRAVAQELVEEEPRLGRGVASIREPCFLDEGVALQPVE
jgi:hypothetical protein